MTAIITPVPQTAIGTVKPDTGEIILSREWYRFFYLIVKAIGGSTSGVINIAIEESENLSDGGTKSDIAAVRRRIDAIELALQGRRTSTIAEVQPPSTTSRGTDLARRVSEVETAVFGARRQDAFSSVSKITGTANQIIASASTGAVTLSTPQNIDTAANVQHGTLGLGMVPTNILDITQSAANAPSLIKLLNGNGGGSAQSVLRLANGTGNGDIIQYGASFTTSGIAIADGMRINAGGAGGLAVGTGASTPIYLVIANTEVGRITAARAQFSIPVRLPGYTVATLPAGTIGDTAYVTDALAPTFLAAVAGGGAIKTPVFYDGTNWVGA